MNEETTTDDQQVQTTIPQPEEISKTVSDSSLKSHRKLRIGVILFAVLLLIIACALYILSSRKGNEIQELSATEQIIEKPDSTLSNATIITIPQFDGLVFEIPETWVFASQKYAQDIEPHYIFYTSEASNSGGAYNPIMGGYRVLIRKEARSLEKEAIFDKPEKAYVSAIGAPKIENTDIEYDKQDIDYAKFSTFINNNDVEFYSYTWSYEGCFGDFIFLDETTSYNISLSSDTCPDVDTVNNNIDLKKFFESIAFGQSEELKVAASITADTGDKDTNPPTIIKSKDVTFSYAGSYGDGYGILQPFDGVALPKMNDVGLLDYVEIGASAETFSKSYQCDGCGFTIASYGSRIAFIRTAPNTKSFTKITDTIYGTMEVAEETAQQGGEAKSYTYLVDNGNTTHFKVTFIVERSTNANNTDKLPLIDNSKIISVLQSIKSL